MTTLELDRATVRYGSLAAVSDLSLRVESGESVAITGPSGSGKTTTLRLLSGLLAPTTGEVLVDGSPIGALDERRRARLRAEHFGFVYQDYNLLPYLTALQNVEVTSRLRTGGLSAPAALDQVGLADRSGHLARELSGGEQQRVSIARALCGDPSVLVADEPTGALDPGIGATILDLLLDAHTDRGVTLVVVTHDEAVADRMSRRVRLATGRLLESSAR